MRYRDLFTGESIMTEQNALRHYISKAKKIYSLFEKYGDEALVEKMKSAYKEGAKFIEYSCKHCPYDIGYC